MTEQTSTRILRCPKCGLTVHAPADAKRPAEGPTCAMGHEPTRMEEAVVQERQQ